MDVCGLEACKSKHVCLHTQRTHPQTPPPTITQTHLDELHEHVDLVAVLERAEELQDEGVRARGQDVLPLMGFWGGGRGEWVSWA